MDTPVVSGRLSEVRRLIEVAWHEDMEHRPGVFLLRESKDGPVRYIGLAENDLRAFMVIHGDDLLKGPYRFYSYRHASSPVEAFEMACKYFHQYSKSLSRCGHPVSADDPGLRCPVHSCGH